MIKNNILSKFLITLSIIALQILTINCSSDSEALASYEGGIVSRKELRDFFEIRGAKIDEKTASIQSQQTVLEHIALQKLIYNETISSGKISKEFLDNLVEITKGQMLIAVYKKEFEEKVLESNPLELISMQMVVLKGEEEDTKAKAEEILSKLNQTSKEAEINSIVVSSTMDESRIPIKGYIEPFCVNCGPDPIQDIYKEALEKNDGKFYLTYSNGRTYILRITETRHIHTKVLDKFLTKEFQKLKERAEEYVSSTTDEASKQSAKYYTDSNPSENGAGYADHLSRQFKDRIWQTELERIRSESKIQVVEPPMLISAESIKLTDFPDTKVLAILPDNSEITIGSFHTNFKEVSEILGRGKPQDKKQELWDMLNFFYNIYLSSLFLQEDPSAKIILSSDLYKDALEYFRYSLTWTLFMKDIASEEIRISETEIRDTYEAGKLFAYSTPDSKNPQKRNPLPYSQVKERIKEELEKSKRDAISDTKLNTLKTEYQLKIATDSLKEGKI